MSPRTDAQNEEIRKITEEKIISAALSLMVKQGLEGTSIKEIANKANISVGLVYRHFDSKQDLFNHILNDGYSGLKEIVKYIKTIENPIEALQKISSIMIQEMNDGDDYLYTHILIGNALYTYNDPIIEDIKKADLALVETIEDKIKNGQELGIFRQGCSRKFAWMLLSSIEGAIKAKYIFPKHFKIPSSEDLLYYLMEVKQ